MDVPHFPDNDTLLLHEMLHQSQMAYDQSQMALFESRIALINSQLEMHWRWLDAFISRRKARERSRKRKSRRKPMTQETQAVPSPGTPERKDEEEGYEFIAVGLEKIKIGVQPSSAEPDEEEFYLHVRRSGERALANNNTKTCDNTPPSSYRIDNGKDSDCSSRNCSREEARESPTSTVHPPTDSEGVFSGSYGDLLKLASARNYVRLPKAKSEVFQARRTVILDIKDISRAICHERGEEFADFIKIDNQDARHVGIDHDIVQELDEMVMRTRSMLFSSHRRRVPG